MSFTPDPASDPMSVAGPLVIVGAGGFGRECLDIVEAMNREGADIDFVGFADDGAVDERLLAARSAPLIGGVDDLGPGPDFVIGIGNGEVRERIDGALVDRGLRSSTLWHPAATLGSLVAIGDGSVVCAGTRLTTNIVIGRHVHLNLNVTVGHDSVLHDFVTVFPGATISGNVVLERGVTVGTGANILPGVRVGEGTFVGAGAVVNRDVESGVTVIGIPARPVAR